MSIDAYSYDEVYEALPAKFQDKEFVYKSSAGVCLIEFADYNGNPYRTSVKKKKDSSEFLYCVDRNNSIEFTDNYRMDPDMFNEELRTRLAIAFYYGPTIWNEKASSEFTTGNFIVDYYMTQLVVHGLIYEYGGDQANMGIDFDKVSFKEDTGNLEKKTKAFYKYCCETIIEYDDGYFQDIDFQFNALSDNNIYLVNDRFISSTISCKTSKQNAEVTNFHRKLTGRFPYLDDAILQESSPQYDSDLQFIFPAKLMDNIPPGNYNIHLFENVEFNRLRAALWYCAEISYIDTTQELGGLFGTSFFADDEIDVNLLIGKLYLYKTDSVTGEEISDAKFQVLQYNSVTQKYEYYCGMTYNTKEKRFESTNLYLSSTNKKGQFQVIETTPGKNYQLDWDGQYFQINSDTYIHEIRVENEPVLGSLTIRKSGEQWSYEDQEFLKKSYLPLPGVKYELYAKSDIYVKNQIFYPKDKKIVDLITDSKGIATVNDLPMGDYYIRELETLDDYVLDSTITEFSITRDENRHYSSASLTFINRLKTSQIDIFKYYYDDKDTEEKNPIPLQGALFGLYLKDDLCDVNGTVILAKDTCIMKGRTDVSGSLIFQHLPYVDYYIKELEPPKNFIINDGIVSLQLEDFIYDDMLGCFVNRQEIVNKIQRFGIVIKKSGEAFTGYTLQRSTYGDYYSYLLGEIQLENVSFTLYNSSKEVIATQTTDKSGTASFNNLIPGTYYIAESSTPSHYKKVELYKDVTLQMDSNEYNELTPPVIEESFFNELCQCRIQLSKLGEQVYVKDDSLQYKYIPLEKIVYGIYQNFDYTFSGDAKPLLKNSCVGYIVTDMDGNGVYTGKLPCGNYYIKELQTQKNYELDSTLHYFDIQPNNNNTIEITLNDGVPMVNRLSKAAVQIIKTDSNTGNLLKGVEFTLYNAQKEEIGVYKTNKKGKITVDNLPYGKYYFVETKSKNGYYSSNNKYYFDLNSDETVTLNITNSPILKLGQDEGYKKALIITLIISIVFFGVVFVSNYFARRSDEYE